MEGGRARCTERGSAVAMGMSKRVRIRTMDILYTLQSLPAVDVLLLMKKAKKKRKRIL